MSPDGPNKRLLSSIEFLALCASCRRPGESQGVTFPVNAAGQQKVVQYRCPTCDRSWEVVTRIEDGQFPETASD